MSSFTEQRSLPELLKELMNDVTSLFRKEVQLAKAEAGEKISKALVGVEMLVFGGVLAIGALGVFLSAVVSGLAAILIGMGMAEATAAGVAALIVAAVVGLVAYMLIKKGLGALKAQNLTLDRTVHSLERDATVLKEKTNV